MASMMTYLKETLAHSSITVYKAHVKGLCLTKDQHLETVMMHEATQLGLLNQLSASETALEVLIELRKARKSVQLNQVITDMRLFLKYLKRDERDVASAINHHWKLAVLPQADRESGIHETLRPDV